MSTYGSMVSGGITGDVLYVRQIQHISRYSTLYVKQIQHICIGIWIHMGGEMKYLCDHYSGLFIGIRIIIEGHMGST